MGDKGISFDNFGTNFQRSLGQMMFEDHLFADQLSEVLDYNFFTLGYVREYVKLVLEYRKKYGSYPSYDIMESVISTQMDTTTDIMKKQVGEYFVDIKSSKGVSDSQYIKESSLDFCKRQALKGAVLELIDSIEDGTYEDATKIIEKALQLGSNRDVGMDIMDGFNKRYEFNPRYAVPTYHEKLDEIINGGLGKKELGILIGGTGVGKSQVFANFAANEVMNGKNVLYYTLELQDGVVGKRIDSVISKYDIRSLDDNKDRVYRSLKEKVKGKLIIKEYPPRYLTLQMLQNHLDKTIRTQFTPDVIFIDYADIMNVSVNSKNDSKYNALGDLYTDLRSVASRYNVALWTISQINRSGYGAEIPTLENMADSFSKAFIADLVLTIQRTTVQKQNNKATLFAAKNRNGPDGLALDCDLDPSRVYLKVNGLKGDMEIQNDKKTEMKQLNKEILKKFANIHKDD